MSEAQRCSGFLGRVVWTLQNDGTRIRTSSRSIGAHRQAGAVGAADIVRWVQAHT